MVANRGSDLSSITVSEMGADAAVAQAQPTTLDSATPAPPPAPVNGRETARAVRRATAMARLKNDAASADQVLPAGAAAAPPKPAAAPSGAQPEAPPAKPAEVEKHDPATERGLRAVEQARKKFLDEQRAEKAELEVQRAEVARIRKEAEGRVTSREDLKKLRPTELLDALDHFNEDDFDIISRASYARTKAGKTDPRAQQAAQEASRAQSSRVAAGELAELRETVKKLEGELRGEFTRRDQASFAERWVGDAIKAIPADKPSFLAKLHANEPEAARRELLAIGAELEKAADGEPPTQAEVIAEFEKRKRASLKAMGLDADALLAPPKPAPPAKQPAAAARTLDVSASNLTRPENAPKTRDEKRAVAIENLRARQRATADQTT